MTDGGHVPGEGLPEHLNAGPDPLGGPEGVAGVAPLQGVATDGGVIPNPAAPLGGVPGAVPPGAGLIPPQGQPNFAAPGVPSPAAPGDGWAVDQGAPRPAFHFVDQPDGLDDEDDVLLMPGPQGSWGAEQAPFAQPDGTPVEPSWPPVDPPVLGGEHLQQPLQAGPAQPYAQQPMTQAQAPRRPLHAGPPIPDPSLMTGQVPVRSLADRGPTQGGTPAHGIPVVGRPPMGEAAAPVAGVVPQGVPQAAPVAPAAPTAAVTTTVEGGPEVHQVPQGQGYQQVPLASQPVEGLMAVETVGAIEVIEVIEAVETPAAVPVADPVQAAPVGEAVPAQPAPEAAPEAQAAVVEPVAAESAAVETVVVDPAAVETAVVDAAAVETAVVEGAVEGAAVEVVAAEAGETSETAAPAGPPRRISAFLAAPTPHGLPKVEAAQQAPSAGEAAQEQPAPIAAADAPQAAEPVPAVEAVQEAGQVTEAVQDGQTVQDASAVQAVVVEPVAETAAGTGEMPSGQVVAEAAGQEPVEAVEAAVVEPVAEPAAEGEQPQPEAVQAGTPAEAPAEPVAEQPEQPAVEQPAAEQPAAEQPAVEQAADSEAAQPVEVVAPEAEQQPAAEPAAEAAGQEPAAEPAEAAAVEEPQAEQAAEQPEAEAVAVAPEAVQEEAPAVEQAADQPVEQAVEQAPAAAEPVAVEQPAVEEPQPEAQAETQPDAQAEQPTDQQPEEPVEPTDAPAAEDEQPAEPAEPRGPAAPGYDEVGRDAVHQVIRERRDIRNGFRPDPIPHEVLIRVLEAAHTAPSVGYSQPWDFVVIRSAKTRRKMHALAERQREAYADSLPKGRAKQFREIKIEAILDTPVNIVVTADRTRGGRHTLGRHTQPQMAPYSAALAVENLWLAARAEGLGVGWVSFFDDEELVRELGLPEHLEVVAYLCVGFVDSFPDEPELEQQGWAKKRPLAWVVHEEQYGNRALPGEEPQSLLADTLRGIRPLDAKALGEAWDRQKRMTKPAGSLGMLEIISAQLCGLSRKCPPPIPEPACVAIFAGDHGVHAQGVSPWPQEVTAQMVGNFLAGGAVINAFAKQIGTEVCVVDVGVAAELPQAVQQGRATGLLPRKVKPGTDDMTQGPAMTREEALQAIEVGIETARDLVAAGNKALVTGDMGIANTTASAALISVFTGLDPAEVTGRGTGIDDETHARKIEVIRAALALHQPDPNDPIGVLAAIGGLEHAAIAGFLLGAASLRTPVVLDGVIAGSAALVAKAIAPEVLAACIAGHRSAEPGHQAALAKLGLRPLIDLDLRLGEGTGALLALPLVQSAARAMHDVATFDSAGVTEKA